MKRRVLIVDDSPAMRQLVALAVGRVPGVVIDEAGDGMAALKALKLASNQPYDLVFLDLNMPLMDGLTCTSLLAKNHQAKVVVVTGGRTTESQALEAGACGFIEKPFDVFDLDRAIHGAVAPA